MFMAMNSVSLKNSVDTGFDGEDSGFSELVTRFCMPLCSRDSQVREIALEAMGKTVEGWLDGYGSPKHHCPPNSQRSTSPPMGVGVAIGVPSNGHCADEVDGIVEGGNGGPPNGNGKIVPKEYLDLVTIHLPAVLRLSINCPFADVREKCKEILNVVKERGVPVPQPAVHGPSAYIPADELPPLGTHNEQTHMLFIDAFLQNNRLDHVTQVIGYHPTYLDVFLRTQNFILRGDGPLPYDYRHFIAIMAAGRHQCSYLINLQKQEFLLQGGDPTWLKGLSQIPQKLRDLYEINKILAHRPWLLNKSHIEKLTKGKDSWSLAEVVHAIVLLAHFHSLSSFVFGCGVNEELDRTILASPTSDDSAATHVGGRISPTSPTANSEHVNSTSSNVRDASSPIPTGSPNSSGRYGPVRSPISHNGAALLASGNVGSGELEAVGVETLMQRMKSLSERAEEFSAEERNKRFEHVESQSAELLLSPAGMLSSTQVKADIGQFVEDPTFLYQDFARRGEMGDIPTFRVQDYSWDDHGYSLVNRLYNDVGNLLDEKFKTAYNLTYYTMGGMKDVDTSRFRRAIWNYIQCMFGIRHDDYDYGEVNQLLERSLKAFIKSACCFPERVTKKDYDSVLREFKHSEKVHVNLMVLEARMQAELLYALRAVMRYMT